MEILLAVADERRFRSSQGEREGNSQPLRGEARFEALLRQPLKEDPLVGDVLVDDCEARRSGCDDIGAVQLAENTEVAELFGKRTTDVRFRISTRIRLGLNLGLRG